MKRDLLIVLALIFAPLAATAAVCMFSQDSEALLRICGISAAALAPIALPMGLSPRRRRVGLLLLSPVTIAVAIGCLTFQFYPRLFPPPASVNTGNLSGDLIVDMGTAIGYSGEQFMISLFAGSIALFLGWIPLVLHLQRNSSRVAESGSRGD